MQKQQHEAITTAAAKDVTGILEQQHATTTAAITNEETEILEQQQQHTAPTKIQRDELAPLEQQKYIRIIAGDLKGWREFTDYTGEQHAGEETATPTSPVRAPSKTLAPSNDEGAVASSHTQARNHHINPQMHEVHVHRKRSREYPVKTDLLWISLAYHQIEKCMCCQSCSPTP